MKPTISKARRWGSLAGENTKYVQARLAKLAKAHLDDLLAEGDPEESREEQDLEDFRREFKQQIAEHVDRNVAVRLQTITARCEVS